MTDRNTETVELVKKLAVQLAVQRMAENAKPLNDDEWGSERQIDAENAFFAKLEELGMDMDEFIDENSKATTDESIAAGLEWFASHG